MARVSFRGLAATVLLLCLRVPAHATSTFSCEAADRNIPALSLEGHTTGAGGGLLDITGVVQIDPGKKIVLDKPDVKSFVWKGAIALYLLKRIERGAKLEITIDTRAGAGKDQSHFAGTYKVSAGSKTFAGTVKCAGG